MKTKVLTTIFTVALSMLFAISAQAQWCNPSYATYSGYGYMPIPYGYYVGEIVGGYAHGAGYVYYYDANLGWTAYRGGFNTGLPHGYGECLCGLGYVAGVWNMGNFVEQYHVDQSQIQQTYDDIMDKSREYAPEDGETIKLPPGTKIKEIDGSTELGTNIIERALK